MVAIKMRIKKLLLAGLLIFTACGAKEAKEEVPQTPEVVNLDEKATETSEPSLSLDELRAFLFEKLDGQQVVRTYGEDTGWTNMIFGPDGSFKGSYMGNTAADEFDGGLNEYAQIYYHAVEIHNANFKGKFDITEQVNDNVYKLSMKDFEITSEYGAHDDIYFNVDFALGINPEAEYLLYIPGTPKGLLPNADTRLDDNYKKEDFSEDKTQGFIIWNKTDDEVFNQLNLDQ